MRSYFSSTVFPLNPPHQPPFRTILTVLGPAQDSWPRVMMASLACNNWLLGKVNTKFRILRKSYNGSAEKAHNGIVLQILWMWPSINKTLALSYQMVHLFAGVSYKAHKLSAMPTLLTFINALFHFPTHQAITMFCRTLSHSTRKCSNSENMSQTTNASTCWRLGKSFPRCFSKLLLAFENKMSLLFAVSEMRPTHMPLVSWPSCWVWCRSRPRWRRTDKCPRLAGRTSSGWWWRSTETHCSANAWKYITHFKFSARNRVTLLNQKDWREFPESFERLGRFPGGGERSEFVSQIRISPKAPHKSDLHTFFVWSKLFGLTGKTIEADCVWWNFNIQSFWLGSDYSDDSWPAAIRNSSNIESGISPKHPEPTQKEIEHRIHFTITSTKNTTWKKALDKNQRKQANRNLTPFLPCSLHQPDSSESLMARNSKAKNNSTVFFFFFFFYRKQARSGKNIYAEIELIS